MGTSSVAPVVVALEGVSGVGKSTVAEALHRRLGWPLLREAFDRLRPAPPLEFGTRAELLRIERRLAREDCRRYGQAVRCKLQGSGVVLDTDFLGTLTYSAGVAHRISPELDVVENVRALLADALSRARWGLAEYYLYLDAPDRVIARRARGAGESHPATLRLRHRVVGGFERDFYRTHLRRLLPGRVRVVNARGRVDEVVDRIVRTLRPRPLARPVSPRETRRVLDSFGPRARPAPATVKNRTWPPSA